MTSRRKIRINSCTEVYGVVSLELRRRRQFPWEVRPGVLSVRRSGLALVGKKLVVARNQLSLQKTSQFAPLTLAIAEGFRNSLGSSASELSSILAESGAYSPNSTYTATRLRVLRHPIISGLPRQHHLPLACHTLPKYTTLALKKRRTW